MHVHLNGGNYMLRPTLSIAMGIAVASCGTTGPISPPPSLGEMNSLYSYIPLDPLPVRLDTAPTCTTKILDLLPDNAIRIGITDYSTKADLTVGPAVLGGKGGKYQVTLDYINADVANVAMEIAIVSPDGIKRPYDGNLKEGDNLDVQRQPDGAPRSIYGSGVVNIPVYVGVGLRLTANVEVIEGKINLASLGAIAAGVEAKKAAGNLVVQTLGINGTQVASSLPLPSELNQTTVQNAIQSLASIKAIMYDKENTRIVARVTGIYNPLRNNDPKIINAIVSELAKRPIVWTPSCEGEGTAIRSS